jgi:hypothetical protein
MNFIKNHWAVCLFLAATLTPILAFILSPIEELNHSREVAQLIVRSGDPGDPKAWVYIGKLRAKDPANLVYRDAEYYQFCMVYSGSQRWYARVFTIPMFGVAEPLYFVPKFLCWHLCPGLKIGPIRPGNTPLTVSCLIWTGRGILGILPNKSMEPTATAVTHPADAGCAPAVAVAHH